MPLMWIIILKLFCANGCLTLVQYIIYIYYKPRLLSAGGVGVMIHIDKIVSKLRTAGSQAEVRGISDSGWFVENGTSFVFIFSAPMTNAMTRRYF